MSLDEIRAQLGPGGVHGYQEAFGRFGAITDDTQLTLFTAEGLLRAYVAGAARGELAAVAPFVANAYARWLVTQGMTPGVADFDRDGWLFSVRELFAQRVPGATCLSALEHMTRLGERAANDSKGCGGVMIAVHVSTAWNVIPSASATPVPTPVSWSASATAPAPAPMFPGVSGRRPASAIAANRTSETVTALGIPSDATIAIAAPRRAANEHAIQRPSSRPVRGRRKTSSTAATRPATRVLVRIQITSKPATTATTMGTGHNGMRPTAAAPSTSSASASALMAPTAAPTPHVRRIGSLPPRVRESRPMRTAPPT